MSGFAGHSNHVRSHIGSGIQGLHSARKPGGIRRRVRHGYRFRGGDRFVRRSHRQPVDRNGLSLDGLDNMGTFGDGVGADGVPLGSVGAFVGAVINFLIVGLVMFLVVKAYNKMQAAAEEEEAGPSEVELLTEIRDNLTK